MYSRFDVGLVYARFIVEMITVLSSITIVLACVYVYCDDAQTTSTPPATSLSYASLLSPASPPLLGNVLLRMTFTSTPAVCFAMSAVISVEFVSRYIVMWMLL